MAFKKKSQNVSKNLSGHRMKNILAAVGLQLLIVIGFVVVLGLLRSYSMDTCLRTLEQETQEAKNNIYLQVTSVQRHLETLADIMEQEGSLTSAQTKKVLGACQDMDMVSRLGILLPNNKILQQDGTTVPPMNGITFKALAEKGSFITNLEQDNLNPDELVLFSNVPIVIDGKTEGILFGVIELNDVSDHFEVDIFDGNADIFIVDTQNMDFIMDTLHNGAENSDAMSGHQIKKGYSEEQLTQDFEKGKGGLTAYWSKNAEEYLYTAYEPIGINDWFVLVTVPESVVLRDVDHIGKMLIWLAIYEALVLVAYILWVVTRARKEIQEKEKIATTDLLTGLKNRNAYERVLQRYAAERPEPFACVYADANGLHELNNSQGHLAGDRMLQCVSDSLTKVFGTGNVYRIGGDEFLVFTKMEESAAAEKAAEAKERVGKEGYHVSIGTASGEKTTAVTAIVKAAEKRMYEDKRQYYMTQGDRRKMR